MDIDKLSTRLQRIYPKHYKSALEDVIGIIEKWKRYEFKKYPLVTEKDLVLIAYGDSFQENIEAPLMTLHRFMTKHVKNSIENIHILPMFPYTSDDGFSVVNYREINPELGTWADIIRLKKSYNLMFDAVINHASKSSEYFKKFLEEDDMYKEFFIIADPNKDYSQVIRPRALPLLTVFQTATRKVHVWTTFSEDQVDLNFKNPKVLSEFLDILLMYAYQGARFIRLDAVGLLWKEDNTKCMHLPQTHEIIKLIRDVLTLFTNSLLITETNVPHEDNISYFGNGFDEASMVYQFPLPPLTLHSYLSGDASYLTEWMKKLDKTSSETTYFNFLASHDGIGLRPIENVLTAQEKERLVNHCISKGGKVNYRNLPNGTQTPYELNINYLDALSFEAESEDNIRRKFLSAQSILLSIVGVPAIYYHSLLGSNGDIEGMKKTGINRRINREKLNLSQLENELKSKSSRRHYIFYQYLNLIDIRKKQSAFNPQSNQEVKEYDKRIVSFMRSSQTQSILVLVNVSKQSVSVNIEHEGYDLISKKNVKKEIKLNPYQYMWIEIHK